MRSAVVVAAVSGGLCPLVCAQNVLFDNGPFVTHAGQGFGGSDASQMDDAFFGLGNVIAYSAPGPEFRGAEDFVVPAGQTWTVQSIRMFAYSSSNGSHPPPPSPFSAIEMKIWDRDPRDPGAVLVSTGTTLAPSVWTGAYRTESGNLQQSTMPIYTAEAMFPSLILLEGDYWLDVQVTGGFAVTPYVHLPSGLNAEGNAMVLFAASVGWYQTTYGSPARGIAYPFQVRGAAAGPGSCYANCDGSTATPILNVADFTCFLQRFAAGESYANCDVSTSPPVLNVADFTCFLQRFAAGCP
jgi:hypothetical protein